MAAATAEPPKQSDFSKVSRSAVDGWMSGLKEAEGATAPKPPEQPPAEPPAAPAPVATAEPATPSAPATPEKPAAVAPEKPAETTEADKWPRSSSDWKAFIKVRDDNYAKRDARIKELESKLTETEKSLKGLPTDPATFETLKTERERYEKEAKDLSERLRLAAIESHPRFKAYYDGKVNAQVELAKRVVGTDKADAIAEALKMPDGAWKTARLEELSANLSPVAASRLGSVLNSIEEIESERRNEVARAKTDYESAQAKTESESKANRERSIAEANARFEAIVKQASDPKEGIAMFQTREGDEAWNKAVKARIDGAKATLFGGANGNPDALIKKALLAEAFPSLLESYNTILTEVATLKSQVENMTATNPSIQTRTAAGANGAQSREPSKVGSRPMDIARQWIQGLQESSRE